MASHQISTCPDSKRKATPSELLMSFDFIDLVHLTCQSSGSAYEDLSPLVSRLFCTPDSPDQGNTPAPVCPVGFLSSFTTCHPFITFSFNYNTNTRVKLQDG